MIRDRVKELRRVKASEIGRNPKNWRVHPKAQQESLRGILGEVGYVDALIARELPDGRLELLDGHLRADTTPDTEVPVLIVDIDDAEAALVLATFDPLSAMATTDPEAFDKLLHEVTTKCAAVQEMLSDVVNDAGLQGEVPDEPGVMPASLADRFGVPPFSVLDARQGYWQDRKRAWLALGIQSELGRGDTGGTSARVGANDEATYRTIGGRKPNAVPGGAPMPVDRAKNAAPGGSLMPAANYSKSKARGNGKGRAIG